MRYEDDIIEEIRSRNDIVDVISQYVQLKKQGNNYFGLCPFHNEKSPSFSVSRTKQMYYCFGCGAGGNVIGFVMQYENQSFPEALSFLAERAGVALPKLEYSGRDSELSLKKEKLMEINRLAAGYYYYLLRQERGADGLDYLRRRALSEETIRSFGLGYAAGDGRELYRYLKARDFPDELLMESGLFGNGSGGFYDRFRRRVIFPIMNANSKVIGFGGRVMDDSKPKYLNSPENLVFDKGRNLYGLHIARKSRLDQMILCEGYMDVIAMHQGGFSNAVASLGTAFTQGHAALVHRYAKEALLLYDSDEAGVRAAMRAIPILKSAGVPSRVVDLKPSKDPDEFLKTYGAEAFRKRLENARDAFLFQVDQAAASTDMGQPQEVNRFFDHCAALLLDLDDELERTLYLETIVKEYQKTGVNASDLRKRLSAMALKARPSPGIAKDAGGGQHNTDVFANDPGKIPDGNAARKKRRENGSQKAQKLMLTWLVTYPELFTLVTRYLSAGDFTQPFYREVAQMLFDQYEQGDVNPAKLMNVFMDPDELREAAELFNTSIYVESDAQLGQAFADALIRIRDDSFQTGEITADPQVYVTKKRELEGLRKDRYQLAEAFDQIVRKTEA